MKIFIATLVLLTATSVSACEEVDALPSRLQRLVDIKIVTVDYQTEEVTCDTKRITNQTCEAVGEAFAEYFHNQRHKLYKNDRRHHHH